MPTPSEVAAGLPYANAVATGHAHNPGLLTHTSYPVNTLYNNVFSGYTHGYNAYNTYNAFPYHHAIGKREADSDAYTIGQVAAGLPFAYPVNTLYNNVFNGYTHCYSAYNTYNAFPYHHA